MDHEGYIKFNCNWIKSCNIPILKLKKINYWRQKLYALGLIGAYSNGIGFGNISIRIPNSEKFVITGSATGNIKKLNGSHYAKVIAYDLEKNRLTCKGPIKASSESLTHASLYKSDKKIRGVMHVHNLGLWKHLINKVNKVPSTSKNVAYGSQEIAEDIVRLFKETDVKNKKIIAMRGHKGGIISFGKNLDEAGKILLSYPSHFFFSPIRNCSK